ncbi:WD repeat-containing protein 44, partial [Perkinsus olseni]
DNNHQQQEEQSSSSGGAVVEGDNRGYVEEKTTRLHDDDDEGMQRSMHKIPIGGGGGTTGFLLTSSSSSSSSTSIALQKYYAHDTPAESLKAARKTVLDAVKAMDKKNRRFLGRGYHNEDAVDKDDELHDDDGGGRVSRSHHHDHHASSSSSSNKAYLIPRLGVLPPGQLRRASSVGMLIPPNASTATSRSIHHSLNNTPSKSIDNDITAININNNEDDDGIVDNCDAMPINNGGGGCSTEQSKGIRSSSSKKKKDNTYITTTPTITGLHILLLGEMYLPPLTSSSSSSTTSDGPGGFIATQIAVDKSTGDIAVGTSNGMIFVWIRDHDASHSRSPTLQLKGTVLPTNDNGLRTPLLFVACADGAVEIYELAMDRASLQSPHYINNHHDDDDAAADGGGSINGSYYPKRTHTVRIEGMATAVALSPDGLRLAVGSAVGTVTMFLLKTLRLDGVIDCRNRYGKLKGGRKITGMQWQKDSQR